MPRKPVPTEILQTFKIYMYELNDHAQMNAQSVHELTHAQDQSMFPQYSFDNHVTPLSTNTFCATTGETVPICSSTSVLDVSKQKTVFTTQPCSKEQHSMQMVRGKPKKRKTTEHDSKEDQRGKKVKGILQTEDTYRKDQNCYVEPCRQCMLHPFCAYGCMSCTACYNNCYTQHDPELYKDAYGGDASGSTNVINELSNQCNLCSLHQPPNSTRISECLDFTNTYHDIPCHLIQQPVACADFSTSCSTCLLYQSSNQSNGGTPNYDAIQPSQYYDINNMNDKVMYTSKNQQKKSSAHHAKQKNKHVQSDADLGCCTMELNSDTLPATTECTGRKRKRKRDVSANRPSTLQFKRRHKNSIDTSGLPTTNDDISYNEGVSHLYIDLGDCSWACEYCNAAFWYGERLKGYDGSKVKYTRCCGEGQVSLEKELDPPLYFKQLFKDKHFLDNIRAYNQMFSMTSFGAQIDESINDGRGPYVFKISGEIYHWIGTLCPKENDYPKFLQLYIYDTQNEVANRMKAFGGQDKSNLKPEIVQQLIQILDEHNKLVQIFRTARDKCNEGNVTDLKIQLYNVVGAHQYQLPSSRTLGAIIFESGPNTKTDYDVIIEYRDRRPQRINKLHSSYMSLQFPLLFVYGQPGFNTKMQLTGVNTKRKRTKLSMNAYYTYQLHERFDRYSLLFRGGRLFQQYVVSVYCALEQDRLDFIRAKQNNIRNECLLGICDAISRGDHFGAEIGKKIILPSSFTGGPRYMYSHYLDALAICRVLGNPQFFITFTCNVNWPEIKRRMQRYPELTPADRADVVDRVFEQKVEDFIKVLKENRIFGRCTGVLYTIEFQKRGLPHCHTLLWIDSKDKIQDPNEIEKFISAELPDRASDPDTYRVVKDMMIHGPCGNAKPGAPCMKEGTCTKKFPKKYNETTYFDKNGHIHYRRRNTPSFVQKGEFKLDNAYVVPYNRLLCLMFHAHINVEYCGWSMLIKYLFKYIPKGTDRIVAKITRPISDPGPSTSTPKIQVDEIQNFIDGRFICPHKAYWRILKFPIHHREPAVQILSVHLKDMQTISFRDKEPLGKVVADEARKLTTLTEWFTYNTMYQDGRHLTYLDLPSEYVWHDDSKSWSRRKIKTKYSIGRLAYVHPAAGELFYFRMLLSHQKGCKSFVDVRTVNKRVFPTYRAACQALGLLDDDKEWDIALQEAALSVSSAEIRHLFAQILVYCDVADPIQLWEKHWNIMGDDIPAKASQMSHVRNLHVNDPEKKGYIMYEIEMMLNNCSRSVKEFGLSLPEPGLVKDLENRLLMEERNYNREELKEEATVSVTKLNVDQRAVYDLIVAASEKKEHALVFLYGHGGTGKTFLWKTIINKLRSEGKIVLAVAYPGIASLLLPSGRTAHSRFKLPLELTDESMCAIKKNTLMAKLLAETDLIVWDEAPMNDRRCFETLDRTLKDILNNSDMLFGGKTVMLGGDFRQTLPVKKKASRSEIIGASIVNSYLWPHFKVCRLKQNMRLLQTNLDEDERQTIQEFSSWLLDIGDGRIGEANEDDPDDAAWITIPPQYQIPDNENGIQTLIDFIYDKDTLINPTAHVLQEKAIVCPKK